MTNVSKYPPLTMAPDWEARLAAVPDQAWWAEEDEPMIPVPPGPPPPGLFRRRLLPHHIALQTGVCVLWKENA